MLNKHVRYSINDKTMEACDDFLDNNMERYVRFMDIVRSSQIDEEGIFQLENLYLLQTREAIEYAYRLSLEDTLNAIIDSRLSPAHFDHNLTTQTMNRPRATR